MADSLPSPVPFKLPEDVHVLAHLRDQLSDYLSTLERNTDSINRWLDTNQNNIIVGHHQLVRAITHGKDEQRAIKVLADLGDTAGFILNLQDFPALATAAFGADSALGAALNKIPKGFPARILEELPEIRIPQEGDTVEAIGLNTRVAPIEAAPAEKKGFWASVGTFIKGEDPEEEARLKEEAIRRHWRNVRSELISLQSDRHYYVDSFMDWIGENLMTETPETLSPKVMEQYQSPEYVIRLAQEDYAEVNEGRTRRLGAQSLDYSGIARTLDEQRITDFIALMPQLFPAVETAESKRAKQLLLTDFNVASFAELALTHVKDRTDQLNLLSAALTHETKFDISGLKTGAQIFEKVLGETLAPVPLDSDALLLTLKKLKKDGNEPLSLLDLSKPQSTAFQRIATRFGTDFSAAEKAANRIIAGIDARAQGAEQHVYSFAQAVADKDASTLAKSLNGIAKAVDGQTFLSLWTLSYPGASVVSAITQTAADGRELSTLMRQALDAGILEELKAESNSVLGRTSHAITFLNDHVIAPLQDSALFDQQVARSLIASSFANGGLADMRRELTATDGWIAQIVAAPALATKQKMEWIATLLEPFKSDAERANILAAAADSATAPDTRRTLTAIENTFAGSNIRLSDDKILTNLQDVANIWYNPEPKTLRFTIGGTGHTLLENVTQHQADQTLELLRRKGGFETEFDGVFKPENIDRIVSTATGTRVSWYRHTTDLNATDAQVDALHDRDDFVHINDAQRETISSINQKSVTLLQPLEDGSHLLVDKYGSVSILEGDVRLTAQGDLVDLGGTWFNPKNASILSLNAEKNTLEFRTESKEFDDFLDQAADGEYFYSLELGDSDTLDQVRDVLQKDPATASPGGALSDMFFNLKALGFMSYENDDKEIGFHCHKYAPARKPGFISTEEDMAAAVFEGLSGNENLFSIENIITHKSVIDDAYYDSDKALFYLVIGQNLLTVACDEKTAYDALKKLSQEDGFAVVGANYIANPAKPGVGVVEMPADIINLQRASLLAFNAAQDKTFVTTQNDKFHISLDRTQSRSLFDKLEREGLDEARQANKKTPWTQDLKKSLALMPTLSVKVTPSLTDTSAAYLLSQVIGAPKETRTLPALNADFSVASTPLKSGDTVSYPVVRSALLREMPPTVQQTEPAARKPRKPAP